MSTELTVVQQVRKTLDKMTPELRAALPAHIAPDHFIRLGQTAVQTGFELDQCTPKSIVGALVKCAEAGLLPDGEEAAIVSYNLKIKGRGGAQDRWEKQAKLMPMIRGLRKQVQQSGQVKDWYARIVYSQDYFKFICGDEEKLEHEPAFEEDDRPVRVYSIAKLENGEISRHVMRIDQIEKIRKRSRNADAGPWVTDWEEMAKKTCMRQHFKSLPRAKDDIVRARLMASVSAFDDAAAVVDVEHHAIPERVTAPALTMHEAANNRLREAMEKTAFDDESGEILANGPTVGNLTAAPGAATHADPSTANTPESTNTGEPSPQAAKPKGKRKTPSERLAEANAPKQPKASQASAGAVQAKVDEIAANLEPVPEKPGHVRMRESEPNANLIRDYQRNQAEKAAADETDGSFGVDGTPDDDATNFDDPQIVYFRAGWIARGRMKSRGTLPHEIIGNKELSTFFERGWDEFHGLAQRDEAPSNAEENENMLEAAVERIFN